MSLSRLSLLAASLSILAVSPAVADPFFFSTGNPDGLIATASRPESAGRPEIESADDFVVGQSTSITGGSFVGLLTGGASLASIGEVVIEIYRVFPNDSDTTRIANVPTRVNSPSDVAFASRSSSAAELLSVAAIVTPAFTANNSVLNGIHPSPGQFTGGDGPITGQEVRFNFSFASALTLPADHYFFIPQVQVTGGEFYWLSAPRPITPPGVPFPSGATDLQSWIRNDARPRLAACRHRHHPPGAVQCRVLAQRRDGDGRARGANICAAPGRFPRDGAVRAHAPPARLRRLPGY
jgi:hypothetical protein